MTTPNFYGVNIDTPLSLAHNTDEWKQSVIGQLSTETDAAIYIEEIQWQHLMTAEYGWRVVDAYWSSEDSVITYFRAFDLDGNMLPQATFGVSYGSVPQRIGGGFKFAPGNGNQFYVPVENKFTTVESGGYLVQVLDRNWPSEGLAFGMMKQKDHHKCLVVSFRLFRLMSGYPNDLALNVR